MFGLFKKKQEVTTDYVASVYAESITNANSTIAKAIRESKVLNISDSDAEKIELELWSIQALTVELILGGISEELSKQIIAMLVIGYFPIEHNDYIENSQYYGLAMIQSPTFSLGDYPIKEIASALLAKLSIDDDKLSLYLQTSLKGNFNGLQQSIKQFLKEYEIVM